MSITSANSILVLTAQTVIPAPVQLMGYSSDEMWTADAVKTAQVLMGADGYMSTGWTPQIKVVSLNFQADSPSINILNLIYLTQETTKSIINLALSIRIPSVNYSYVYLNGAVTEWQAIPDGKQVLQPQKVTFNFNSIQALPI